MHSCDSFGKHGTDLGMVKIGFTAVRVPAQTFLPRGMAGAGNFIAAGETQSLDMLDEAFEQYFVLKKKDSSRREQ